MNAAALLLPLACALGSAAYAAPFPDPTRPPNALPNTDAGAAAPEGPRLESVLIAPDRRIAVISGQQYRMGDKYGEGRIVRINESEVAIRSGEAVEVLQLIPGIDKRLRQRRTKGTR